MAKMKTQVPYVRLLTYIKYQKYFSLNSFLYCSYYIYALN